MFIGTAIGVYSSIFLAAPLLAVLKKREARFRQLEQKLTDRERVARRATAAPAATPGASTGEAAAARATAGPRPPGDRDEVEAAQAAGQAQAEVRSWRSSRSKA